MKENKNKEKKTKKNDGVRAFFTILAIIILIFGGMAVYKNWKENSSVQTEFNYHGLDFKVSNGTGNKTQYTTVVSINRMINGSDMKVRTTFSLLKDPRETYGFIEKAAYFFGISPSEDMTLLKENKTYVSFNQQTSSCADAFPAYFGLGTFLALYGLDVKGATTNSSAARDLIPFIDCGNSTNNTVIIIGEGDYTGFKKLSKNCYEISFKECEILKATEKFQLAVLEQDFGED